MPLILAREPTARLVIVGSDPPPEHAYADFAAHLEMLGFVEDVREPLARYAVFVCPILSGSGVRVKLLEAFAAGIPVVSTVVGAEGLARKDGEFCALADDPAGFADRVLAAVRESRGRRRDGRASARRGGSKLGYGGDHPQAGGGVSGLSEGEEMPLNCWQAKASAPPEPDFPRSFLRRATMSDAEPSRSVRSRPLGGAYADQTTCRDFTSTRKTMPLPRPNAEFSDGLPCLFAASVGRPKPLGSSFFAGEREPALSLPAAAGTGPPSASRKPRRCDP